MYWQHWRGEGGSPQDRRLVSELVVTGGRCIAEAKACGWRPSVTIIRSKSEDVQQLYRCGRDVQDSWVFHFVTRPLR